MTEIVALNRTLDQELLALMRGASLECPVCGEFVLHTGGAIALPASAGPASRLARNRGYN